MKTHCESIFKQERERLRSDLISSDCMLGHRKVLWGMRATNCLRATKGGLAQRFGLNGIGKCNVMVHWMTGNIGCNRKEKKSQYS